MPKRTIKTLDDYAALAESPVSTAETRALFRDFTAAIHHDLANLGTDERIVIAGLGVFSCTDRKGRAEIVRADGSKFPAVPDYTVINFRPHANIRRARKS